MAVADIVRKDWLIQALTLWAT